MKRATNTLFVVLMVFLAVVFSACSYHVIESASGRTVYLMNDKRWFFLQYGIARQMCMTAHWKGFHRAFNCLNLRMNPLEQFSMRLGRFCFFRMSIVFCLSVRYGWNSWNKLR